VTDFAPGWQRLEELPFEPARGYHAAIGSYADGFLLSVKGAPESVLERCRQWASPSGLVDIDDEARDRLTGEVERLARQGLRLLAAAEASIAEDPVADGQPLADEMVDGLVLLGFLVLTDPVRPTAAEAVSGLRRAGVNVAMVTGDHPSTAEGIAVQLGILNGHRVLTGAELANMSDDQLAAVVGHVTVYARVTPADKVRIVRALQQRGQAVAMTGDGANDAPAIKLADVGIAVGTQATPAARRAADLVVTDERIETIVDAIIEGRAMWASVKDALAILLGGNLGEVAFTVGATAITGRAPLSPRQLLAVNLLTDVAPALAIAVRPPTHRTPEALLDEGPEASLGRVLERTIAVRAASTALGAGTAWALASLTGGPKRASTTALIAVVGAQLGQTLMSSGWDPVVMASGAIPLAALVTIVQVPGLSQFCGCTPLDPLAWGIAWGSTIVATGASVVGSALVDRVARDRAERDRAELERAAAES
jgi:cation-transporting ATPase I